MTKRRLVEPTIFAPKPKDTDLIFASYFDKEGEKERESFSSIYVTMAVMFEKLLDRLKIPLEASGKRHKITLHSFRRWVKSTVSDNSNTDFSEFIFGHRGSVYYTRGFKDQLKQFKKVEPYLTYLDPTALEARDKNLSDRLETMERENIELRNNINKIMEMIRENPKLAQAKPEVLVKRKGK